MNASVIEKIFADTAYIRTGGSDAERTAAEYIAGHCAAFGLQARLDPFVVDMATITAAVKHRRFRARGICVPAPVRRKHRFTI